MRWLGVRAWEVQVKKDFHAAISLAIKGGPQSRPHAVLYHDPSTRPCCSKAAVVVKRNDILFVIGDAAILPIGDNPGSPKYPASKRSCGSTQVRHFSQDSGLKHSKGQAPILRATDSAWSGTLWNFQGGDRKLVVSRMKEVGITVPKP